ncbi:MAG: hypothetical protein DRN15_10280 [Thermoprotei archaeon]|nr:MAG: hypothetical protein DRN15_10280 [Thermoprotei archaeon]
MEHSQGTHKGYITLKIRLVTIVILMAAAYNALWMCLILYSRLIGASELEVSLVTSISSLFLMTSIMWGYLADRFGYYPLILIADVFMLASSMLVLAFQSIPSIMASRCLTGLGTAMFIPSMMAMMVLLFEETATKGSLVGLYSAAQSAGWALGVAIGGFIAKSYSLLASITLTAIMVFMSLIITLMTRIGVEPKGEHVNKITFRNVMNRSSILLSITCFLRDGGILGAYSILPLFLKELGATEDIIGALLAINTITQIPSMLMIGRIAKGSRTGWVFTFGVLGTSATILIYSLALSYVHIIPAQLLLALSFASFYVGSRTLVSELYPRAMGTMLGLLTLFRNAGGALIPLLAGYLWHLYSFRASFRALALIVLASSFMALLLTKLMESQLRDIA